MEEVLEEKPQQAPVMEIDEPYSVTDHRLILDAAYASPVVPPPDETFAMKHMPELGHEVADFQVFNWRLTKWKTLEKKLTSPHFPCGGHSWRILLFPSGNSNAPPNEAVSIYLDYADPQMAPKGWHACAQFALVIYDSKAETGFVGLKNQGATCYMNSLLQSLYCTNAFRKAVYQIPTEEDTPSESVALALQRVFYSLQTSDTAVGTTELTRSFGWKSLDSFLQHDVQEFNRVLQEKLEAKMKGTAADGAITKLFVGKMKSYIKCVNVDFESSRSEDFYDIQLNVKGMKNLIESFKDYVAVETLEGDNKYHAEGLGLQDAKKGVIFESFPDVLHLQLKRFEYDVQKDAMVKINDRHEFPYEIDLEPFLDENADRSQSHVYKLHGVLVHSGDLHGGHYFALIKPDPKTRWLKFDDDRVTPVTDKEVLEENYGGEGVPINGMMPVAQRNQVRASKRMTNAYMLVYIRESALDTVLHPFTELDTPPHLRKRLEDERIQQEAKKREREEQHLYLTAKVISDKSFQEHQGFDLATFEDKNWPPSELSTFRVLKLEPYLTFKGRVAKHFNIPEQHIRLWVLVNRQNKTKQTLTGVSKVYVLRTSKVGDLAGVICEKMRWAPQTPIKLYEEIKPSMIELMKPKSTFTQSEIQDGDIICFQSEITDKEIAEFEQQGLSPTPVQFYDFLQNRVLIYFKPRDEERDKEEFDLVLSKKMNYETLAQKVGEKLKHEPIKLRFTSSTTQGMPKAPLKRALNQSVWDIIQPSYLNAQPSILYYERLDVSIIELETKRSLKVIWTGVHNREEGAFPFLLPKTNTIHDLQDHVLKQVTLSQGTTGKIRLFEITKDGRHQSGFNGTEMLGNIPEGEIYAEEIPREEYECRGEDKLINCFHYSREPSRTHGVPFRFVAKPNEKFSDTKKRIQERIGVTDKEIAKYRFALIQSAGFKQPTYLEDEDVVYDHKFATDDVLGLDHVDKSGRSRGLGAERAIVIKG
ncbi:hypothetical protein FRB99_003895 [Tulasnella sp. 403]|nr:hypothetical protein FRB99_003895 [Tulasnella sp. 403]